MDNDGNVEDSSRAGVAKGACLKEWNRWHVCGGTDIENPLTNGAITATAISTTDSPILSE